MTKLETIRGERAEHCLYLAPSPGVPGEGEGVGVRVLLRRVFLEVLLDFLEGEDGVGGGEDVVVLEPLLLALPGAVGLLEGLELVGQLGAPVVSLAFGVGE